MTRRRFSIAFCFALIVSVGSPLTAAPGKWDTGRTSTPETPDELRALEAAFKGVVSKATPATVGIMVRIDRDRFESGSGVIVSPDGLILTAGHISGEPGRACEIIFPDGKRVRGKSLGRNERRDSGMIQITDTPPTGGWPTVEVAKSTDVRKNQWVVTLGHPGGFQKGRPPVARQGRVLGNERWRMLTSCTIVGGDSGGPLFDLDGKLIGIHASIGWSLSENIHVPTDAFKREWDELKAGDDIGKSRPPAPPKPLSRAVLGIEFDEKAKAARVAVVSDDGPAAKAGLKVGDVIVAFDGVACKTAEDVRDVIRKKNPGDEIGFEVTRDGKTVSLKAKLAPRAP